MVLFSVMCLLALAQSPPPTQQFLERDGIRVEVICDPVRSVVAAPIRLVVKADAPIGATVKFEALPAKLSGLIPEAVQVSEGSAGAEQMGVVRRQMVTTFRSVRPGAFEIPPVEVKYRLPDSDAAYHSISSEPIPIFVESGVAEDADPTEFRDIKQPEPVSAVAQDRSYAAIALFVAGMVSISLIAGVLWRSRRHNHDYIAWALSQIDELETVVGADSNEVCDQLASYVRGAIQDRQLVQASAHTTEQLVDALRESGAAESLSSRVNQLLSFADLAKFGAISPIDADLHEDLFDLARSILKQLSTAFEQPEAVRR